MNDKQDSDFASKAHDLGSLEDTVNDAATVGGGLWLTYILTMLYLFIAAGGVTHEDLFLQRAVKIPFLGVSLPLVTFFSLCPLLFIVLHIYVLLNLAVLADKVGAFEQALINQVKIESIRSAIRQQLPSSLFVQMIAGPIEIRKSTIGFLMKLVAHFSLLVSPVVLIAYFEIQFLPYHNLQVAWWQRFCVFLDILLLWTLWPTIAAGRAKWIRRTDLLRPLVLFSILASSISLVFVCFIVTGPQEWPENLPASSRIKGLFGYEIVHDRLFVGNVDADSRRYGSVWSNRIVLLHFDASKSPRLDVDGKVIPAADYLQLWSRNLDNAVLSGSNLKNADLTGANLKGAQLDGTQLQGAILNDAQLQGAYLNGAQLQGSSLVNARLQAASLETADLEGASLDNAHLEGASLSSASLQGASLVAAQLQGASLNVAHLQGASLEGANLQGANLRGAELQSASLSAAFLWLADAQDANTDTTRAELFSTGPCANGPRASECSLDGVRQVISNEAPEGNLKVKALERVKSWFETNQGAAIAANWVSVGTKSPSSDNYKTHRAEAWEIIGCNAKGAPFLISAMLERLIRMDENASIAAAFLNKDKCPGAFGISERDRATLLWLTVQVKK